MCSTKTYKRRKKEVENMKNLEFLVWLLKLAKEEYNGDINLCLLELNIQGHIPKWYFIQ